MQKSSSLFLQVGFAIYKIALRCPQNVYKSLKFVQNAAAKELRSILF